MSSIAPHQDQVVTHLGQDPILKPVLEAIDYPDFNGDRAVYESLLNSIISQQLSVKAAQTIYGRFLNLFDGISPAPAVLRETDVRLLREAGISRQKASYLISVADHFSSHSLEPTYWSTRSDEAILEELVQIKGLGRWTVQMVLMFTLDRPDIFPVDDLGIRKGMMQLYGLSQEMPRTELYAQLETIAAAWSPYRTVACKDIWRFGTKN
jgi:DNA-3-methyladenine glycosylase II